MISGVAVLVIAGAAAWNAHRIAGETIDRHRARYEKDRERLARRTCSRPPLSIARTEGIAEEVVARFEDAVAEVTDEERERLSRGLSREEDGPTDDEVDAGLLAHSDVVEGLDRILGMSNAVRACVPDIGELDAFGAQSKRRVDAASWLRAVIRREVSRGQQGAALRHIAVLWDLGADFGRRGPLIMHLVGSQIESSGLEPLGELLAQGLADPEAARLLVRALDVLESARPDFAETIDFERTTARGFLSATSYPEDRGIRKVGWRFLWSFRIYRAAALEDLDPAMDRLGAILTVDDLPGGARRAQEVFARAKEKNLLLAIFLLPWEQALRVAARAETARRLSRTSLAVALHVAEKGTPPRTLADLVPDYLTSVPIDPWDGKPIRYAPGERSRLWSVGRDAVDEGGIPYEDPEAQEPPGDVVITIGRRSR